MFVFSYLIEAKPKSIAIFFYYSVLVSVSWPKALLYLKSSDNLFRITLIVADWLGWNPYHCCSFCTVSSSYPQPPNLCTEAVIDHAMLAHWMKPRYNQSAILLPAFGRSIRGLRNDYSSPCGGAIMHEHWMNIQGLLTQSTMISVHKFGDRGYDNGTVSDLLILNSTFSFKFYLFIVSHSSPECESNVGLTELIWVLRKPTGVFLLLFN